MAMLERRHTSLSDSIQRVRARAVERLSYMQENELCSSLRRRWHELRNGQPGQRFRIRYQQARRSYTRPRRLLKCCVGGVLFAVGVVLLVVPGPGLLFVALGGALLAEESYDVARTLDRAELRIRQLAADSWRSIRGD